MAIDFSKWSAALPSIKKSEMYWDAKGVHVESKLPDGKKVKRQLTSRPIIPINRGFDQDGMPYLQIAWADWSHAERLQWLTDAEARTPKVLESLPAAPVDPVCAKQIARWMAYAPAQITTPPKKLATRLGWIEGKFVWPGHLCDREWVGPTIDDAGDIAATTEAVRLLARLDGDRGCLALVVLGMSAASPLVRWGCTRNPILGLAQGSSRGKSTALGLGLSIWGNPSTWSLQGGSTVKGAQDLSVQFPDTPILLEDLHKLNADRPDMVQDLLYFCGNGQRRITSSRSQSAKGGEERKGVAFYAAEHQIIEGAMGGVVFRTWELAGDPMPDGPTARAVASATHSGRGAAGPRLAAYYSSYPPDHWRKLLASDYRDSKGVVSTDYLAQGDIAAVRCLAHGLVALRQTLSVMELDPHRVCDWLIRQIGIRRRDQIDQIQAGWDALIQAVLGGMWGKQVLDNGNLRTEDENRLQINNEVIAWRVPGMQEESWEQLDINISSTWAARILYRYGGERTLLKAWIDRGWVERNGAHLKWLIRDQGRIAMRVSRAQLAQWTGPRPDDHGGQLMAAEGGSDASP